MAFNPEAPIIGANATAPISDVASRVKRIEDECSGVWAQYGIDFSDRAFLNSIRIMPEISIKQEEWLKRIERKAFPGANKE